MAEAGVGVDIVQISRMERIRQVTPGFFARVFTTEEVEFCETSSRPMAQYACRFAAREAVLKALGTGFGPLAPADVEITHDASGAPAYLINEKTRSALQARGAQSAFLSVTHDGDYAMATAILEG